MKIEKIFTDAPNQKVIDNAIYCIDKGNIIIIPTDSVYAFACDALNNSAIEKICSIKAIKSDRTNLSIICCDIAQASEYARIDNATFKMMRKNLPGPLYLRLPSARHRGTGGAHRLGVEALQRVRHTHRRTHHQAQRAEEQRDEILPGTP